jgi:hypothetical protein
MIAIHDASANGFLGAKNCTCAIRLGFLTADGRAYRLWVGSCLSATGNMRPQVAIDSFARKQTFDGGIGSAPTA